MFIYTPRETFSKKINYLIVENITSIKEKEAESIQMLYKLRSQTQHYRSFKTFRPGLKSIFEIKSLRKT